MSSVTDLREVVDDVIGVDTQVLTHSAAVICARTGGVLDEITVEATADGYAQLVDFADEHAGQVFSLVIAAPEKIRERFRGQKLPAMIQTAAGLRVYPSWDVGTTTTVTALRSLARRVTTLTEEAAEHEKAIRVIVRSWRPDLLDQPSRCSPASHRSRPTAARSPAAPTKARPHARSNDAQALHRPRPLPATRTPADRGLTIHRNVERPAPRPAQASIASASTS